MYDPRVGRWLSEDPLGFAAGETNVYRYVGNQPTDLIDPSGLIKKSSDSLTVRLVQELLNGINGLITVEQDLKDRSATIKKAIDDYLKKHRNNKDLTKQLRDSLEKMRRKYEEAEQVQQRSISLLMNLAYYVSVFKMKLEE
jgi:uncharacterized protein RhaS with RHS repeats